MTRMPLYKVKRGTIVSPSKVIRGRGSLPIAGGEGMGLRVAPAAV